MDHLHKARSRTSKGMIVNKNVLRVDEFGFGYELTDS